MTLDEQIAVLQAIKDGRVVESRLRAAAAQLPYARWSALLTGKESLNFLFYEYRIKPEPKEIWVCAWIPPENYEYHVNFAAYASKEKAETLHAKHPVWGAPRKYREVIE